MNKIDAVLIIACIIMLIIMILLGDEKRTFLHMQLFETYEQFLKSPKRKRGILIYSLDYIFISLYMTIGLRSKNYLSVMVGIFDILETSIALYMVNNVPKKSLFETFRILNILKYTTGGCAVLYGATNLYKYKISNKF